MKLKIENEKIRIIQDENINEKSINIYEIEFEFSEEWNELTKKLIVSKGSQTQEIEIIDNQVIIPSLRNGIYSLGVVGYIIENEIITKRKSTNVIQITISTSAAGYEANTEQQEEHASIIDKKIVELNEILQETEEAVEDFGNDVVEKVQEYNDNATTKTQTFNQNATNKTTDFNDNAIAKTEAFNQNAVNKTNDFNDYVEEKKAEMEIELEDYAKTDEMSQAISGAVGTETTNRQNADLNLQSQIDAIVSASDVVDVVSSYTDLQNYDTTKLTADDVIKVMQDSTHNNAISYYRWVITNNVGAWNYVGSEGPFYTKGETDTKLADYVKNTDYATDSKSGVLRSGYGLYVNPNGVVLCLTRDYQRYNNDEIHQFISKGTLENVITGKELVNKSYVDGLIGDIATILDSINGEVIS